MELVQGELWWIKPTPKVGSEQRGTRPGLIIQNNTANRYLNTTIVAMLSTSGIDHMPEMVQVGVEDGLDRLAHVDFAQVFTIDKCRLQIKIGMVAPDKLAKIEVALQSIFSGIL